MSNIGLLMASVLTTGFPSAKELPYSPQVEASFEEASKQQNQQLKHKEVKQEQEKPEIQSSQIAPPETLDPDMSGSNVKFKIEEEVNLENLPQIITPEQNLLHSTPPVSGVQESKLRTNGDEFSVSNSFSSEQVEIQEKIPEISDFKRISEVRSQNIRAKSEHSALKTENPKFLISKLTSVSQLDDVQTDDWAFGALKSLIERYGCISGYKNGTYAGNRVINRYEFAADLASCTDKINELIADNTSEAVTEEDLRSLQRLKTDFQQELQHLKKRIEYLEEKVTRSEEKNFSPTTKLFGQVILSLQGNNNPEVDLFPRDGETERQAKNSLSFNNSVQLTLATSFTGKDLLLTGLSTGNLGSSAPLVFNNMGRLGYESDTDNDVVLNELSYRFAVSENLGFVIGTAGVNSISTFRGINPLEGSGEGAISLFGQRNPILTIGNGRSGVGFDLQISDRVSLQGIYNTEFASFPSANGGGLFNGRYSAGAQLSLAPTNNLNVGIHYLYSHSPDSLLGTGIGDAQLVSPFAPVTEFDTQAVGATVAWRINPNLEVGGWGGWTYSDPQNISGNVQTSNWAIFAALPNLGKIGNLGGAIVGQPPKITSSSLPDGFNFPNFSDGGTVGGRKDTSLHIELFYRAQVNQNLSLTPGFFVVFNPDHNKSNDPLVVGALRATYQF